MLLQHRFQTIIAPKSPDSGAELDAIIKHADHAMYEDKSVRKSMRC